MAASNGATASHDDLDFEIKFIGDINIPDRIEFRSP